MSDHSSLKYLPPATRYRKNDIMTGTINGITESIRELVLVGIYLIIITLSMILVYGYTNNTVGTVIGLGETSTNVSKIIVNSELTVLPDPSVDISTWDTQPIEIETVYQHRNIESEQFIEPEALAVIESTPPLLIGEETIITETGNLVQYELPSSYYPGVNFSYFKSWMPYTALGRNNQCGRIAYSSKAYTDDLGLRRYTVDPGSEFTVNGKDDYLVAVGNFYKKKGEVGQRFLIVTAVGNYTVRVSDEKADAHTDQYHMFTWHGKYAGMLEFLVDKTSLHSDIKRMGTVSAAPDEILAADITNIYRINDDE